MSQRYASAGVLYHPQSGKVLLHHRDGGAPSFPNQWHTFGGGMEEEDGGDPVATWRRELREELGITVAAEQVIPLYEHVLGPDRRTFVFYCEWPVLSEDFVLGEGDRFAWFTFDEALRLPDLTEWARERLLRLRARAAPPATG
ncbi:MAG TPA: NUDIX domain-containing protein [Chloroflexota bacterium]|nr:NUDIX domain-containing protein [Chloroflexota bacterium]